MRARHVVAFFSELLVHTRGPRARQPFVPAGWQRVRVLEPLFGEVVWEPLLGLYIRRYRTLYLLVARKNGKTELVAGIMLYLLVGVGEEGGELYGLALDRDQAGYAWSAAARMVELSPLLRQRVEVVRFAQRMVDYRTASIFAVLAGDAPGSLGKSPSAAYIDELLTQPDRELYDALRTGFGARAQPLLILATTAENDPHGFAATEREYSLRVLADPSLDPSRLVVTYQVPADADWTDERNWPLANPALGDYLEWRALRDEYRQARNNPAAERSFRQFRLNQPTGAVGRAIDLATWDRAGEAFDEVGLVGREAYGGLDLAQRHDLAVIAWLFPDGERHRMLWRIFTPEANVVALDRRTGGRATVWAQEGWLTVTQGEVIDYHAIATRLQLDRALFDVRELAFDPWGATMLVQDLLEAGWPLVEQRQGWASMAAPTSELLRLIQTGDLLHGGNPVVRWCASNAVTRSDPAGNLKWDRERSADKIDPIVAGTMALARAIVRRPPRRSPYERRGLLVV